MTTVNDRIGMLIKELNINKNSFSKAVNTSASVIQNIVGGRKSKPGYDLLNKIVGTFDVNPTWLLIGQGEMLRSEPEIKSAPPTEKQPSSEILDRLERVVAENALLKKEVAELKARLGE